VKFKAILLPSFYCLLPPAHGFSHEVRISQIEAHLRYLRYLRNLRNFTSLNFS